MKKKLLVTLLAASFAFTMLAGCGKAESAEGQARGETGSEAQDKTEEADRSENGSAQSGAEDGAGSSQADGSEGGDGSRENGSESDTDEKPSGGQDKDADQDSASEGETGYVIPEVVMPSLEIPDSEAFAFVRDMKIGWNLGNTFDAFSDRTFADELEAEAQWVGVATTREMIDDIREAGFNSIRIPVSWHDHVDENYQISELWLNRVQEVVDYAYDSGMYVILNIHHDNSEQFMYPSTEYLEQSVSYVTAIWQQLADRFADYDQHMIFEGMNEPRQVGTAWEWWIDPASEDCKDAIACINTINQAFVDTVRATGGNNKNRYLMVPGYDASPDGVLNEGFVFPTDAEGVKDRLILSVHAYTPYKFALQGPGESGSTAEFKASALGSTRDITYFMDRLYNTFIQNGIPVVIDEFGARDKGQNTQARVDYATYYIAAARARGMTCFWWDNNVFEGDGEIFGIYHRQDRSFPYPEIVEGLMKYAE